MSSDNTILILRLRRKKKYIWLVINVKSHECFANAEWTRWWIYRHCPQQYTTSKRLAYHISQKINETQQTEYGIIQFNSRANIDDFELKNGELVCGESVVIEPANNHADIETEDSDWIIIGE